MIQIANPEELQVKQDAYNYILLKIYSDTCIPCKQVSQILNDLEPNYPYITFLEMNGTDNRDWCISHNIRTVPYLILFDKESNTSYSLSGASSKEKIQDFLNMLQNSNDEEI